MTRWRRFRGELRRRGLTRHRTIFEQEFPLSLCEELVIAARTNDAARLKDIIAQGMWIDSQAVEALSEAASAGHVEALGVLVAAGAWVGHRDEHGFTALHGAASNGHLAAVDFLLRNGAGANVHSSVGLTPFDLAPSEAARIVQLIEAAGRSR